MIAEFFSFPLKYLALFELRHCRVAHGPALLGRSVREGHRYFEQTFGEALFNISPIEAKEDLPHGELEAVVENGGCHLARGPLNALIKAGIEDSVYLGARQVGGGSHRLCRYVARRGGYPW